MRRKCSASHGWWASERGHGLLWDGYFLMWLCRCVCAWESSRYTERYPKQTVWKQQRRTHKTPFLFSLCDLLWTVCFMLLLYSSHLYWACSVMSVPQLGSRACARASSCARVCFIPHFFSYQFVAVLSGTSECARLSFCRCLDSVGLNSVD